MSETIEDKENLIQYIEKQKEITIYEKILFELSYKVGLFLFANQSGIDFYVIKQARQKAKELGLKPKGINYNIKEDYDLLIASKQI